MAKKYYIISGEASGDLHGSNLMKAILKLEPEAEFRFWGGNLMQEVGGTMIKHYRDLAFMGFLEVLLNLRTILRNIKFCKEDIKKYQPDTLILIDYPGFNLRIAKFAKKLGIRVVYYISPQLWAWKENRVATIKKYVDEIITVSDYELMEAFLLLVEKHKLVAENSGILPLAGLKKLDCKGKKAVAIVSGGNIDVLTISSMINKGLVLRGRIFTFSVNLPDKPGQLVAVSEMLADADANVIKLDHNQFKNLDRFHEVELQVTVETNGEEHIQQIIDTFKNNGYIIKRLNSSETLSE